MGKKTSNPPPPSRQLPSVEQHLQLLGLPVEDIITGITGVVDSVCFDVYGCVQATIRCKAREDGTIPESTWYDVKRLRLKGKKRVMDVPAFATIPVGQEIGAADKPIK